MIYEECLVWRLQTVTVTVLKYWLNQLKGEWGLFRLTVPGYSPSWPRWSPWSWPHCTSVIKKQRMTNECRGSAGYPQSRMSCPGIVLPQVKMVLRASINKIGHTHRHTQRFIPYVTLEPVTMTPWQLLYPTNTDLFHSVSIPCISYICVYVFLLRSVLVITVIILHVCNSC